MRTLPAVLREIARSILALAPAAVCSLAPSASLPFDAQYDTVQIELTGVKDPECSLTGIGAPFALGRLERTGERTFSFTVSCNAPYSYAVASRNGGLTLLDGEPPARIPYAIAARIGGVGASGACDAAGGPPVCAVAATPEAGGPQTAQVTISWRHEAVMPPGVYQDELVFTVQPQP